MVSCYSCVRHDHFRLRKSFFIETLNTFKLSIFLAINCMEKSKPQFTNMIYDLLVQHWSAIGFPCQSVCESALTGEVTI